VTQRLRSSRRNAARTRVAQSHRSYRNDNRATPEGAALLQLTPTRCEGTRAPSSTDPSSVSPDQNEYWMRVMIMRPISGAPGKVRTLLLSMFWPLSDHMSFWLPSVKRFVICASIRNASGTSS